MVYGTEDLIEFLVVSVHVVCFALGFIAGFQR